MSLDSPPGASSPRVHRLAHISDLHLGSGSAAERAAEALCRALVEADVDHVLVTGDVTHRGRRSELSTFRAIFEPLRTMGRVTLVPGNHDRMTDDVSSEIMAGPRVQAAEHEAMYVVRFDSSARHNRALHRGHGEVTVDDLSRLDEALGAAPQGKLRVLMLHHHASPLPGEDWFERITCWLGLPWCAELRTGGALLERLLGKCDLVLHGHRHVPSVQHIPGRTPLRIFNAGSSTWVRRLRVFRHSGGVLLGEPEWLAANG